MSLNRTKLLAFVLSMACCSVAQTWTYQGTEICYNGGSSVQCYARGSISNFVADREHAFDNAARAGAGVGSLAGVLIAGWLHHRQQVKIETTELANELNAYFDAEFELLQDQQTWESDDQTAIAILESLDSGRKVAWEAQLASSQELYSMRAKYTADLKGLEAMQMKEKHRKTLRYFIDHEPDGAKVRYERQRQMAAQGFVVNQFLKVLIESYKQQPPTSDEQQKTAKLSLRLFQ